MNTFYTMNGLHKLMEKALKRNDYERVDAITQVMHVMDWIMNEGKFMTSYAKGYIKITDLTNDKVCYIKYSEVEKHYRAIALK